MSRRKDKYSNSSAIRAGFDWHQTLSKFKLNLIHFLHITSDSHQAAKKKGKAQNPHHHFR